MVYDPDNNSQLENILSAWRRKAITVARELYINLGNEIQFVQILIFNVEQKRMVERDETPEPEPEPNGVQV